MLNAESAEKGLRSNAIEMWLMSFWLLFFLVGFRNYVKRPRGKNQGCVNKKRSESRILAKTGKSVKRQELKCRVFVVWGSQVEIKRNPNQKNQKITKITTKEIRKRQKKKEKKEKEMERLIGSVA
jgi:hypothetical protein